MTYQEVQDRLNKVEIALNAFASGNYASADLPMSQAQLQELKEQLENQLKVLAEEEGTVSTDDPGEAEKLAKKGVNVQLTKEIEDAQFDASETKAIGHEVGKSLALALRELGDEVSSMRLTNVEPGSFKLECDYKGAGGAEYSFYISEDTLFLSDYSYDREIAEVGVKPSGEAIVNKDVVKDSLVTLFKSMNEATKEYGEKYPKEKFAKLKGKKVTYYGKAYKVIDADEYVIKLQDEEGKTELVNLNQFKQKGYIDEGMSDEEFADAQEKERLDKHPEKKTIEKIQAMMAKEKTLREDWGSSDQAAMNQSMHRYLGEPKEFPGLSQIMDAAEDAVDFYWDDWEEYKTDREGLVMNAARMYARKMFPDFMSMAARMLEPVDEAMDFNDPIAVKLRAAQMKAKKDAEARANAPKPLTSREEELLRKLKIARAQLMRDMEQEAEMEGGPIADKYGDDLNKIDIAIAKILKKKVNEGYKVGDKVTYLGHPGEITAVEDQYGKIFVSVAYDKGQGRTKARGILATSDSVRPITNEAHYSDYSNNELAAYCKNNPEDKAAAKELHKRSQALKDLTRTDESHTGNPDDKYEVKPCSKKDEPFAVWEGDKRVKGFKTKKEAQAYADKQNKEQGLAEATKEEEDTFHKKLDNLVHKTFGKREEEMNEAPEGMYYIRVDLRDARKALALIDDNPAYAKAVEFSGSDLYYLADEALAYDLMMDFGANDITISDTNVEDDELDLDRYNDELDTDYMNEASAASIQKKHSALVNKMKELAKEYGKAEGDKKDKIKDQLKDMTAEKKQLEKDLTKAVAGIGKDQEVSDVDEASCNSKKKMNESISKQKLRSIIETAYIEVLREEEGAVLATGTQELLKKFPTLERNIVNLFTEDHEQFIEAIEWVAPKPTTFKVVLKNGQSFMLKWMGKGFQAQIMGKRFFLDKIDEYQQALDKLNELLKHAPVQSAEEPIDAEAGDLGSGGGGGDFPGEEGGEDLDFEEPATGDEEVEFEEPGEEPEA